MSLLPEPPSDEFDDDGRHVHPYVRDSQPDASAPGFTLVSGDEITQEDRSRESRIAFHVIEEYVGHLTPLGMTHLIATLMSRLYSSSLAEELREAGLTREELDPRNELVPFEALHHTRLRTIQDAVEAILGICPACGREHGEGCANALQPGGYVNAATGDAVRVVRVEEAQVYVVAEVDQSGRKIDRVHDRYWFEERFVRADDVEVLGGHG